MSQAATRTSQAEGLYRWPVSSYSAVSQWTSTSSVASGRSSETLRSAESSVRVPCDACQRWCSSSYSTIQSYRTNAVPHPAGGRDWRAPGAWHHTPETSSGGALPPTNKEGKGLHSGRRRRTHGSPLPRPLPSETHSSSIPTHLTPMSILSRYFPQAGLVLTVTGTLLAVPLVAASAPLQMAGDPPSLVKHLRAELQSNDATRVQNALVDVVSLASCTSTCTVSLRSAEKKEHPDRE